MPRKPSTLEAFAMLNYKKGESFFTEKSDTYISALSGHYKRKCKTEKVVAIDCRFHSTVTRLVKVEFVN